MKFFYAVKQDLDFLKSRFNLNPVLAVFTNRGFHALLFYRVSNLLYKYRIPLLPLVFTRVVQIFYGIDIDYKCTVHGGVVIIHGVGTVIGSGAVVGSNVIIYHGVTLGRKRQIAEITPDDGFPEVKSNCVLGAGAKLIGPITIGENSIIGPNVVLMSDILPNSIVKVPSPIIKRILS